MQRMTRETRRNRRSKRWRQLKLCDRKHLEGKAAKRRRGEDENEKRRGERRRE